MESEEHAIRTPSHRAQIGVQTKTLRRRRSCEAQGPSSAEGLCLEARSGLRRGIAGDKVGIHTSVSGDCGTLLLGGPPHGRKVCFPQWRAEGDRLRPTTTWLLEQRQPRQGTTPTQGTLRALTSTTSLERKLDNTLLSLKFKRCASKHGMYLHCHGEQRLIVGMYIDNLIIIGGDMEVLGRFKREMSKNFKMSDLGELSYYLDIEVQ